MIKEKIDMGDIDKLVDKINKLVIGRPNVYPKMRDEENPLHENFTIYGGYAVSLGNDGIKVRKVDLPAYPGLEYEKLNNSTSIREAYIEMLGVLKGLKISNGEM